MRLVIQLIVLVVFVFGFSLPALAEGDVDQAATDTKQAAESAKDAVEHESEKAADAAKAEGEKAAHDAKAEGEKAKDEVEKGY